MDTKSIISFWSTYKQLLVGGIFNKDFRVGNCNTFYYIHVVRGLDLYEYGCAAYAAYNGFNFLQSHAGSGPEAKHQDSDEMRTLRRGDISTIQMA